MADRAQLTPHPIQDLGQDLGQAQIQDLRPRHLRLHVRTASEWLVRLQMYLVVAAVVERISALVELVEHVPQLTNSPIKGYMEVAALDLV